MEKDLEILRKLIEGFNCNFKELARELKIPYTTLIDKVKRLVKRGYILGFIPKVNLEKINIKVLVVIFKDLDFITIEKIKEILKKEKLFLLFESGRDLVVIYIGKSPERILEKFYKKGLNDKIFYYSISSSILNQNLFIEM